TSIYDIFTSLPYSTNAKVDTGYGYCISATSATTGPDSAGAWAPTEAVAAPRAMNAGAHLRARFPCPVSRVPCLTKSRSPHVSALRVLRSHQREDAGRHENGPRHEIVSHVILDRFDVEL